MEAVMGYFENAGAMQWVIVATAMFAIWFLPAALALMFNRKHFKLILIACVPAGFSLIAWSGLIVWAVTGNMVDKYRNKVESEQKAGADSKVA